MEKMGVLLIAFLRAVTARAHSRPRLQYIIDETGQKSKKNNVKYGEIRNCGKAVDKRLTKSMKMLKSCR